jgi:hypothetical protein
MMDPIETRADAVLRSVPEWIWDGERLPVPVEDIADTCFGLLVRDVDDPTAAPGAPPLAEGQSLSGLLLSSRGEIWVNALEAQHWPPRRRFTIGHELGHWVMHRTGQQSLFCRTPSIDQTQLEIDERPPLPPREEEANAFAAALLMPAHLIKGRYDDLRGREDAFEQMCHFFDSSEAAMRRRLAVVI